uniref:Serpin 3 n=1 Tax=Psoroptes ovis TaxID=83912 RepID=A0A8F2FA41_PSOOV|nr:serpin 3 [Psoroptes ovis]
MFKLIFVSLISTILFQSISFTYSLPEPIVPKEFVLASNTFGINLFHRKSLENEQQQKQRENIFLSPFSVSIIMAMLQQGSNGETFDQINYVSNFKMANVDNKERLAQQSLKLIEQLSQLDSNGLNKLSLKMANALMINKNYRIRENFNETMFRYFDSELLEADFIRESELVMATINHWCSARTNGMIENFLRQPPSQTTQMALINAIYFKGNWRNRFQVNQTMPGTFYGLNNETYDDVLFMKRQGRVSQTYLTELESHLVEFPYEGEDVSMFAILPKQSSSKNLMYIRKALNPWYIESIISRLSEEDNDATVVFPKLRIMGKYDLKETLKDMGLVNIFEFGRADLSGITEDLPIAVDDVRHQALIDINEDGTEAAASTYIGFVKMSLQPSSIYKFDHPFILFIRHNLSGQLLFLGEIHKP